MTVTTGCPEGDWMPGDPPCIHLTRLVRAIDDIGSASKMRHTWATRDPETGRHHRNAHLLQLAETDWVCRICGHYFDAASDADLFACGDPCASVLAGVARDEETERG